MTRLSFPPPAEFGVFWMVWFGFGFVCFGLVLVFFVFLDFLCCFFFTFLGHFFLKSDHALQEVHCV